MKRHETDEEPRNSAITLLNRLDGAIRLPVVHHRRRHRHTHARVLRALLTAPLALIIIFALAAPALSWFPCAAPPPPRPTAYYKLVRLILQGSQPRITAERLRRVERMTLEQLTGVSFRQALNLMPALMIIEDKRAVDFVNSGTLNYSPFKAASAKRKMVEHKLFVQSTLPWVAAQSIYPTQLRPYPRPISRVPPPARVAPFPNAPMP